MYAKWIWLGALSVAVAGLMWQFAGFGGLFAGTSPGDTIGSGEQLEGVADNSTVDTNFTGDASPNDGNLVGLVLSGIGEIFTMVGVAVQLPFELMGLGAPSWMMLPLGTMFSVILSIGLVQMAAKRIFK